MTAHDAAIEAGAAALATKYVDRYGGNYPPEGTKSDRIEATLVVDAAEPLIRADEAARHHDGGDCECTSVYADGTWVHARKQLGERERLRAQVAEELPSARDDFSGPYTALEWVSCWAVSPNERRQSERV